MYFLIRVNSYRKLKYSIFLQKLQILQFYWYNYFSSTLHTQVSNIPSQCINYEIESMQLYCYCFKTMLWYESYVLIWEINRRYNQHFNHVFLEVVQCEPTTPNMLWNVFAGLQEGWRKRSELSPAGCWRWWRRLTSRGAGKPCAVLPTTRWWKSGQRGTRPKGSLKKDKHSISAGAPWEKHFLKHHQDLFLLFPDNLGVRSPVMGSYSPAPAGWGPPSWGQEISRRVWPAGGLGGGVQGHTGQINRAGMGVLQVGRAHMESENGKTCWPWGKHGRVLGKLWKFCEGMGFQELGGNEEQKHYQYKKPAMALATVDL